MSDLIPWFAPWSGRVVVLVAMAIALGLAVWFWRRPRTATPTCGRCGYDLSRTPGMTCPECGRVARSEADRHRGRRRWVRAIIALLVLLAIPAGVATRQMQRFGWDYYLTFGPGYWMFPYRTIDEVRVEGCRVRWVEDRDPQKFRRFAQIEDAAGVREVPNDEFFYATLGTMGKRGRGDDINGDGLPEIVLTLNSGGSGCVMQTFVYRCRAGRVEPIATLPYCGRFEDPDADGVLEFVASDRTYAYWVTSGAGSPNPEVVFEWRDGAYVVAIERMRTPRPTPEEYAALVDATRTSARGAMGDRLAPILAGALDLIHTGHADLGWSLIADAWVDGTEFEDAPTFIAAVRAKLDGSPFADAVRAINGE